LSDSKKIEQIKNNFYVFDTETTKLEPLEKNFVFCVLYGYNFQKIFYTQKDFIDEISKEKYSKKYIFAHNAEFDLLTTFGNLYKKLDSKTLFNGRFICARFKKITFADSMNIFDISVEKIGKSSGIEKIENKKVKSEGLTKENMTDEDIEYCIRDCEIVYSALLKFFEYVGVIRITLAGLSMYNFRNKFLKIPIEYSELVDEFYESYRGGRTEVFKLGQCECDVYDINSLFPYVMSYLEFPDVKNLKKETMVNVKFFKYALNRYEGLAKVRIRHKETYIGYLPYFQKLPNQSAGKVIFPVGEFTGVWNFNELRFAMSENVIDILEVFYIVYGNPVKTPFKDFVNFHYNKRVKTDDEMQKHIEKFVLNKLYGRFAMRMKYTTEYFENIPFEIINELEKTNSHYSLKTFSENRNDCFLVTENEKFKNSFFAIPTYSSYITSEARIILLKALLNNENNVLYCDTDSLFIAKNDNGYIFKGDISNSLGAFKKEKKEILEIRGLKNYVYKNLETGEIKETIKGINKRAEKLDENRYLITKYYKTKEALRRNKQAGENFQMIKELKNSYDKRIVNFDGTTKSIKL
jgi:hypothetical protein